MRQSERGLSFIELIMLLTVIAGVGVQAIPALQTMLSGFQANNAAYQIAAVLRLARTKAINHQAHYKVTFEQSLTAQIYRKNVNTWIADGAPVTLPTGVTRAVAFVNPKTYATFDATGAAINESGGFNGGTIDLWGTGGQHYRILVEGLTGQIKVQRGDL